MFFRKCKCPPFVGEHDLSWRRRPARISRLLTHSFYTALWIKPAFPAHHGRKERWIYAVGLIILLNRSYCMVVDYRTHATEAHDLLGYCQDRRWPRFGSRSLKLVRKLLTERVSPEQDGRDEKEQVQPRNTLQHDIPPGL